MSRFNPAENTVRIQQLARKLNDLMSRTAEPDSDAILHTLAELKEQTADIKAWIIDFNN